jgi:gluconokinase
MPHVPGLRSPYDRVAGLVYFGRMIDKIRLHAAGTLPEDYHKNVGKGFDMRCAEHIGLPYDVIVKRALEGGTVEEVLAWCRENGAPRSEFEIEMWNCFLLKRGWRDSASDIVAKRIGEYGITGKPAETFFDLLDYDEGRDPHATQPWKV